MDYDQYWDYHPGDHVMTIDGLPGVVKEVTEGLVPGNEDYLVELDNGMGGGHYTSGMLTRGTNPRTAKEHEATGLHLASEDYPELGELLWERPDPGKMTFTAASEPQGQTEVRDTDQPDSCSYCGSTQFKDQTDNGRVKQATCAICGGTMSAHPGTQWTPELIGDPSNHPSAAVDPASGASGSGGQAGINDLIDFDQRITTSSALHTAGFDFTLREQQTGGTKFPVRHTLNAWHGETGEHSGSVDYFPPKRRGGPVHIDDLRSDRPGSGSALMDEVQARHPDSAVKFLREVKRDRNTPSHATGEHGKPTDWDEHYPGLGGIHRGFAARLAPEHARVLNDPQASKEDHVEALKAALPEGTKMGLHWTSDRQTATNFSHHGVMDPRTDVPVVLHARVPDRKSIETRPDQLFRNGVFPHDYGTEREVPIRRGKPVEVTGISWKPDAEHPEADENGWLHHDFAEPMRHTAAGGLHFTFTHGDDNQGKHLLELHHGRTPVGHMDWDTRDGDIGMIDVDHRHRRQGYGSMLWAKADQLSDEHGTPRPGDSAFWTHDGSALREHRHGMDVSRTPTTVSRGAGEGDTDLAQHIIDHHGMKSSADTVRGMAPDELADWHEQLRSFDPCGFGKKAAVDGPDWCTWRRAGQCTYPNNRESTVVPVPQVRGACPWDTRWEQQVCPISEPGPMALMEHKAVWSVESGAHEAALEVTAVDDDSYRLQHQAPDADYGSPLHDVTQGIFPHDFYDHPEYYHSGQPHDHDSVSVIRSARDQPEKMVHVYRSLPGEHAHKGIRPGDWVSTSKEYARQEGRMSDPKDDYPVIRAKVPAKHLHTEGDVNEWGYNGPEPVHGMVVYKGGYNQEVRHNAQGEIKRVQRKPKSPEKARGEQLAQHGITFSHYKPNQHGEGDHNVVAYDKDDNWAGHVRADSQGNVQEVEISPEHRHLPLEEHMRSMLPKTGLAASMSRIASQMKATLGPNSATRQED